MQVQNLTQGTSLNLNGLDLLHLIGTVSIEQIEANGDNSIRIYPNPMTENSKIEFEMPASGSITVELLDTTGKKVTSTQNNFQAGTQAFNKSGLITLPDFYNAVIPIGQFNHIHAKIFRMESIIIKPRNKQAIPFLMHLVSNLKDVKSFEVINLPKNQVAKSIASGLMDAKEILAKNKTANHLKN